ncbi:MAG: MFS transporter [Actinomycetota bacterium]
MGMMMLVPTLPVYLQERADSLTAVSAVLAAAAIGGVAANVPVGILIGRMGERVAFLGGLVAGAAGTAALALGGGLWLAFLACLVAGAGQAARLVARQSYARRVVDIGIRGRVMSIYGGIGRVGLLVGPLLGGFLGEAIGLPATFVVAGAFIAAALVPALIAGPGEDGRLEVADRPPRLGLARLAREHGRIIALAGLGQLGGSLIRVGRLTVVPLYGAAIGLDVGEIGLVVGLAGGLDLLLFPMAGWLMDRFGRLYAIVPSFAGLGLGLMLLPLTDTFWGMVAVGLVIGLANGIGSGTMLTLSTDLAPGRNPAEFLGAIRLLSDLGRMLGPLVVGVVADRLDLSASAIVLGFVGLATALLFVVAIGEPADRQVPDGVTR